MCIRGRGGAERAAVEAFAGVMTRKAIDYMVITLLEQQFPISLHFLTFLGLVDWRVIEASGAINEPRHVRKDLRFDRIKTLFTDPAAHFADAHGWGQPSFDPEELMDSVLAFFPEESSAEVGKVGGDAFLVTGPLRWSRDSSVNPPGIKLDYSARLAKSFTQRISYDAVSYTHLDVYKRQSIHRTGSTATASRICRAPAWPRR